MHNSRAWEIYFLGLEFLEIVQNQLGWLGVTVHNVNFITVSIICFPLIITIALFVSLLYGGSVRDKTGATLQAGLWHLPQGKERNS